MPSEASGRPELRTAQGPPAEWGGCPGRRGRNCQHSCGAHGGTAVPAHLKRCRYSAVGKPTPRPSGWAGRKSTPPCPCTRARYALGSSGSDTLLRSLGPPAGWRVESAHLGRELRRAPEAAARLRAAQAPLPRGVGATCALSWREGGRWGRVLRQGRGPFPPAGPALGHAPDRAHRLLVALARRGAQHGAVGVEPRAVRAQLPVAWPHLAG